MASTGRLHAPAHPGTWIRGITIKHPHAECIVAGAKTIENRPRPWSWRGWLLLHASQSIDRPALRLPLVARTIRGRALATGTVIGVARLTGCHQDPADSLRCTPWAEPGAWHLELSDVQALALPIPARGQLGPWKPTEELVAQVLQQLPNLRAAR
ncbi:hypothetical protein Scani_34370 [Streptomyces caniferus]|uniref:ASCH domain-containing protein n=1 Tax=Streptomyces caniferus TaxID=285557 RepID=A0A640S7E8_9ACTN|nr:hypothetical protein [Streptomyces caniferus]GFE07169.1 hypothetical protein Scani_34370 [Streptomyces caniferus]